MGFALSVLYIVTSYLTPATLFGPLATYRIELVLAALIVLVSGPALVESFIWKTSQSLALIGLAIAAFLSVIIGEHWTGGAVQTFLRFVPNVLAYFLVCLHCNSKRKLQVLVLMLLFVCLFVIARGSFELRNGVQESTSLQVDHAETNPGNVEPTYLFEMKNDAGESIYRLRGMGEINDPNDFGQLIVCVFPLLFIFWYPKKLLINVGFVLLPACILLYGLFLTHSRGSLVALIAIAVVAARRRIGTLPALMLAAGLFVAAMALHFTGGREITAESGSDRTELWSESLQILKAHPLFGVGLGDLPDYLGHTSHNSVAVCAAELGLFGLYFWSMFLLPTVGDVLTVASRSKMGEGLPIVPEDTHFIREGKKIEAIDKSEINHLGSLVVLSLTGFLVAGWFLSRAFVLTLFLLGGIAEVVYEMALQREMIGRRIRLIRVLPYSGVLAIALVLMMYIIVRIMNLMR
jgi:hypothetical protein